VAVRQREDSHEATQVEARAEGADRARGAQGQTDRGVCAPNNEISRAQYDQWRDLFLANAARALESAGASPHQGRLEGENARQKGKVDPAIALTLGQPTQLLGPE
jgi:hypothetical protein